MSKPVVITREIIGEAALNMIRESGLDSISARSIAERLGCSTQPIYKAYGSMKMLKEDTMAKLADFMMESITSYKKTGSAFMDSGLGLIHFAKTEKVLFQLFCLDGKNHELYRLAFVDKTIRKLMEEELPSQLLSKKSIDKMYFQTMVFTYGLAVLVFLGHLKLNENEIAELLDETFESYLNQELEEKNEHYCTRGKPKGR